MAYTEYGKSTIYLELTGHLQPAPGGVQLQLNVSFEDSYRVVLYLPLGVITLLFLLSSITLGFAAEGLVKLFIFWMVGGLFTYLMRTLTTSFSHMRVTQLEAVLVGIIRGTIKTDSAR